MELHRIHKIDLVVIYIQSIDYQVYNLIKRYQMDRLVEIRGSISMPQLDTMAYNPNSESQWNNQLVNFGDCLYEFRDSAEFIAFPDWDDLMITNNFIPLIELMEKLIIDFPKVGSFIYPRYVGAMPTLSEFLVLKF